MSSPDELVHPEDPVAPAQGRRRKGVAKVGIMSGFKGLFFISLAIVLAYGFDVAENSPVIRASIADWANNLRVSMANPLKSATDTVQARSQATLDQLRAKIREVDVAGDARVYFDFEECLKRKYSWSPASAMTNSEISQVIQRECSLEAVAKAFIDLPAGDQKRAARAAELLTHAGAGLPQSPVALQKLSGPFPPPPVMSPTLPGDIAGKK